MFIWRHTVSILSLTISSAASPLTAAFTNSEGASRFALGDSMPPIVTIDPATDTFFTPSVSVTIEWCDDKALNSGSRLIKFNGQDVTSSFSFEWLSPTAGCGQRAESLGSVTLSSGSNTLYAQICDAYEEPLGPVPLKPGGGGACQGSNMGSKTVSYTYDETPPPAISTAPHNGDIVTPELCAGCFDLIYTHSTPAYVTLDAPQAVTLFYSSHQAAPRGILSLDAWNPPENANPPDSMSVKLKRPNGTWVEFTTGTTEIFYAYADGDTTVRDTVRLSAQFDAAGLSSGAYGYTAVITSWWSSPAASAETTLPVRILVLNEADSGYSSSI